MKVLKLSTAVLWLAALGALGSTAIGCGDDPATSGTSASTTGTATGGGGGAGGTGEGGAGGTGGTSAGDYGPPSSETVNAGEVSKSAKYKMVYTLGQPTQNQGNSTSPKHRLQGGVIGATGSLP